MTMRLTPLLAFLIGCAQPVIGNGQPIEDVRGFSAFTAVKTYGVNARVALGDEPNLVILTDSNLQAHIHTEVTDGVLRIDVDDGVFPTQLTALIVVTELSEVGNYAGADLWVSGIDGGELSVLASGEGHTELLGTVDTLTLISSGAGVRNASELTAADVTINLTGSGVTWVTATDAVVGDISSSSTLNVFGDPTRKAVVAHDASEVIYY